MAPGSRPLSQRTTARGVARVQRDCGLDLEVIDGAEEARLTALGVLSGAEPDERALCIDVPLRSAVFAFAAEVLHEDKVYATRRANG